MPTSTIILIWFSFFFIQHHQERPIDLLTSRSWAKIDSSANHDKAIHHFHKNGQYVFETWNIQFIGKWVSIAPDEISFHHDWMKIDTMTFQLSSGLGYPQSSYHMRILEISEVELITIEKHEGDLWDSPFVKKIRYIATSTD